MIPNRQQLEEARHMGYKYVGYKTAFCELNDCCENCDPVVYFWCMIIRKIEDIQIKRIRKICK